MKKWNASVEEVAYSLQVLTGVYHCRRLRLLGGEPMLNPDIVEIIKVAKHSGVADILQMLTNGMLLDRLPDEGWEALDEIEISFYEISRLSAERIEALRVKGKAFATRVNVASYPSFRMTFTTREAQSPELVNDVWSACKMANVWGCHAMRAGRIYRCPQSIYALGLSSGPSDEEGFAISEAPDFKDSLLRFLNGPGPLKSCSRCVGSCGKKVEQASLERRAWKADLDVPFEDMIDFELLEKSKREMKEIDDCRVVLKPPRSKRSVGKKIKAFFLT
jgi:hypothetical protein